MKSIALIAAERVRQINSEGWTLEHDIAEHPHGEIAMAAASYAIYAGYQAGGNPKPLPGGILPTQWLWDAEWWKPSEDPVVNLVKAGALISAEIDRQHCEPLRDMLVIDPSDPEVIWILRLMCFQCIDIAQDLRKGGKDIERKAEAEQAAVMIWLLQKRQQYGEDWKHGAETELLAMRQSAAGKAVTPDQAPQ